MFWISCEVRSIYKTRVQLGFNIKTSSISATKKEKKKSPCVDIFYDNIFEAAKHGVNYKKRITKLAS